jgi:hypothetical protein
MREAPPSIAESKHFSRLASAIGTLAAGLLLLASLGRRLEAQSIYTPYKFVTIAGAAGVSGAADGPGSTARFSIPAMLAVDASGNVFVADTYNQTIREIVPTVSGGVTTWTVSTIAGVLRTTGNIDGPGATAEFSYPIGIAVDRNDNVYVADENNGSVRKITPTVVGGVTTWNVSTLASGFDVPAGVAVDANGYVYTDDQIAPDSILKISPAGAVTALADGSGGTGYANGPGSGALFNNPYGLAADASGDVFVADGKNRLIREVTPAGVVSTVAGVYGAPGFTDGPVSIAQLGEAAGVAVDGSGNVYATGIFYANVNYGNTIRMITTAGQVTTLGGVPGVTGSSDGSGALALFNNPDGVAVDSKGNVYVADTDNDTIRMGSPPSVAPTFTLAASPASVTIAPGRTVVFNAIATGTPAPSYQWTFNNSTTIPGASTTTDSILMVTGTTLASAGTYTCTATNSAGSVSTSATLAELATPTPGYLTNLSARANVGTGANILIGGVAVTGSGTKTVLIRGDGPSLALPPFNITGILPNPQLQLYSGSTQLYQNDNWGTPAYSGAPTATALTSAFSTLGAFSLTSGSLDSALLVTLPISGSGQFTALVSDVSGNTGVGLVELYDADSNAPGVRLVNVSARNLVGTGANILIAGFTVGGSTAETLLIRGDGPALALAPFNLSGTLAQPVLQIYNSLGTMIYSNTGWGGDPNLATAMATVGAFGLPNTSQDSAMLVTLPAGPYTALISGSNNTVGIALVEVYEVY